MRLTFKRVHMYFKDNTFTEARCTVDGCSLGIVTDLTLLQALREAEITVKEDMAHIVSVYMPGFDPAWVPQPLTEWQKTMQQALLDVHLKPTV